MELSGFLEIFSGLKYSFNILFAFRLLQFYKEAEETNKNFENSNRYRFVHMESVKHPSLELFYRIEVFPVDKSTQLLFAASTCGRLFAYTVGQQHETRLEQDPPKTMVAETNCGLSALAVVNDASLLFVGSEFGRITPVAFEYTETGVNFTVFSSRLARHYSTITGKLFWKNKAFLINFRNLSNQSGEDRFAFGATRSF